MIEDLPAMPRGASASEQASLDEDVNIAAARQRLSNSTIHHNASRPAVTWGGPGAERVSQ